MSDRISSTKSSIKDFNKITVVLKLYLQNYNTPTCKLGFRNRSFDICTVLRFGFWFVNYEQCPCTKEIKKIYFIT